MASLHVALPATGPPMAPPASPSPPAAAPTPSSAPATLTDVASPVKTPLARYQVERQLCETRYGETLLARDGATRVVLKRIALDAIGGCHENPLRERDVMQLLVHCGGHRRIVRYVEPTAVRPSLFVAQGSVYLAMEHCTGGDLYEYVTRQQPHARLPEQEALRFVQEIAEALAFLHGHGIAHRDLSLENVLLQPEHDDPQPGVLHAKLCDFGLSCGAHQASTARVGKLYYMAPEVAATSTEAAALASPSTSPSASAAYDPSQADVWSLGIMLFVLLTGSPLVADDASRGKTLRILRTCGVARILSGWGMEALCGADTCALLTSLLQVDPWRRPSIHDVLRHPAFTRMALEDPTHA